MKGLIANWRTWKFPHKVPAQMKKVYDFAETIRKQHPELWKKGGNIQGNESYAKLATIVKRGYFLASDAPFIQTWQAWMARHYYDFRIPGLVAQLKWLSIPEKGFAYMKKELLAQAEK